MSWVTTSLAVSVDGYLAGPDDGRDRPLGRGGSALFDWFTAGDVPSRHYPSLRMHAASAAFFDAGADRCGAVVTGRRTYDVCAGWGGAGPLPGVPTVVLTHAEPAERAPAYSYVTTGIADAVAVAGERARGRGREITLMGSGPVRAALAAGLLDEVVLHVVPVLLGSGVRLLDDTAVSLERTEVVVAPGVTHERYWVLH